MEVEKGLISVEISNGGGERGLGWLGLTASLDQWRWRSVVAGPDRWCWLGFFLRCRWWVDIGFLGPKVLDR